MSARTHFVAGNRSIYGPTPKGSVCTLESTRPLDERWMTGVTPAVMVVGSIAPHAPHLTHPTGDNA